MKKKTNPNIAFDTLNMINLFNYDNNPIITKTISGIDKEISILHIPHSSYYIPSLSGFVNDSELIEKEKSLLTDHYSDDIFNIKDIDQIVTPFSRIFCDVERLPDNQESLYEKGRGFYYTHTDDGKVLRNNIDGDKEFILRNYYNLHQDTVIHHINNKLLKFGKALIIDCHTFNDKPLETDVDKDSYRPDICIGVDEFHTPKNLVDHVVNHFLVNGFTVGINSPYKGTFVPLKYYKNTPNVHSIMIEINQKLYMGSNYLNIDNSAIQKLNDYITDLFI